MAPATASKAVGGQVKNLHTINILLSWESVLTKDMVYSQRFDPNTLENAFEK